MKTLKLVLLTVFGLITSYTNAQIESMTFSQSNGSYNEITGDSIVGIATDEPFSADGGKYELLAKTKISGAGYALDINPNNDYKTKEIRVITPKKITHQIIIIDPKTKRATRTNGGEKFIVNACDETIVVTIPQEIIGFSQNQAAEYIAEELSNTGRFKEAKNEKNKLSIQHKKGDTKIDGDFKLVQGRSSASTESNIYLISKYLIKMSGTALGGGAVYLANGDLSVATIPTPGQTSLEIAEALIDSLNRKTPDDDSTYSYGLRYYTDSLTGLNDSVDFGIWQLGNRDLSQTAFQSVDQGINMVQGPLVMSLDLGVCIEGLYNNVTNKIVNDTVTVFLRNTSPPYSIVDTSITTLDSSGMQTFYFFNAQNSVPYYIHVKHRNAIETWSSVTTSFVNSTGAYDFRSDPVWAFGNNTKRVDTSPTTYGFYSGDVNQNGLINLNDIIAVYNNASSFVNGYVTTDVTGDNRTDLSDILITYNNSVNFIEKITP